VRISLEDLQFWNVTTAREPFTGAYKKALDIVEKGMMPEITWHEGTFIEVKSDGILKPSDDVLFKKFKQSKTVKKKKDKKK